jgi:hypothetical protein
MPLLAGPAASHPIPPNPIHLLALLRPAQDGDSQLNLPLTRAVVSLVLYALAGAGTYVYLQWVGANPYAHVEMLCPKKSMLRYVRQRSVLPHLSAPRH